MDSDLRRNDGKGERFPALPNRTPLLSWEWRDRE